LALSRQTRPLPAPAMGQLAAPISRNHLPGHVRTVMPAAGARDAVRLPRPPPQQALLPCFPQAPSSPPPGRPITSSVLSDIRLPPNAPAARTRRTLPAASGGTSAQTFAPPCPDPHEGLIRRSISPAGCLVPVATGTSSGGLARGLRPPRLTPTASSLVVTLPTPRGLLTPPTPEPLFLFPDSSRSHAPAGNQAPERLERTGCFAGGPWFCWVVWT
jgi:hypothetical protein